MESVPTGGSWSLTRLIGTAKARELYLLGNIIAAETAHVLGLVEDDALHDDPDTRPAHRRVSSAELPEMEAVHQARTAMTEDHLEASHAFAEKRRLMFRTR
jgi:2-(1,2-epoxy-1,2-dihydrophenyl)acetyl-CoA isomerase